MLIIEKLLDWHFWNFNYNNMF